jgi:glucuronate isomerase
MGFLDEDFLLTNDSARHLYHEFAAGQPILDYHCHLPPRDLAENRRFDNLYEIWLEGDHYKWRAMRANGIDERFITGDAGPKEKFLAWARTVPETVGNPLFLWTHLELRRYFGIDEPLDPQSAEGIWNRANEALKHEDLSAWSILAKFHVTALSTTDDPVDDLQYHHALAGSELSTRVYPAFRPDKALGVDRSETFRAWVARLGEASGGEIRRFPDFLDALRQRHDHFHRLGCRLSDHGLDYCYADFCTDGVAEEIFDRALAGQAADRHEHHKFASYMMLFFGFLDAEKGWTKQLHLGARRNACSRRFRELGPDTGFDAMGEWPQIDSLHAYLDRLDQHDSLPKTIVYNHNPVHNYAFATLMGSFQDGRCPGKMQLGSGWWFLDQRQGIEWQLRALSNVGLLSRFVGMVTDSRSFMSYPRHEYFRRVLCDLIGGDVETGQLPDDDRLLGPLVRRICYENAAGYLGLEVA